MKYPFLSVFSAFCLVFTGCNDKSAEEAPDAAEAAGNEPVVEPAAPPEKKVFVLGEGSSLGFSGENESGRVGGRFANFVGKFEVAGGELVKGGKNFITVDMSSILTREEAFTELLKGEGFFDVEKYPIARFQLRDAVLQEGDTYEVSGILDLHGVAKKITFPARFTMTEKETLMDLAAEIPLNRQDYEIAGSGDEENPVPDEVTLRLKVNAMPGEPKELVIGEVVELTEVAGGKGRPGGGKGGGGRGKGGGKGDWRNMTEEERAERRRQFMAEMDKNGDGNLGKDEVPERMWSFIGRADTNGDNQVSPQEREEARARMQAEREIRELTGDGGMSRDSFRGGGGGKGKGGGGSRD